MFDEYNIIDSILKTRGIIMMTLAAMIAPWLNTVRRVDGKAAACFRPRRRNNSWRPGRHAHILAAQAHHGRVLQLSRFSYSDDF
jgi:hypothetical protein